MLLRQGLVAEALDALEQLADLSAVPGLRVDQDDQDRITLEVPFDPLLVEALRRLPGAARDKDAGLWRVAHAGQLPLVGLLERVARPPCAPDVGCTLDDEAPPSCAHRDAHERM